MDDITRRRWELIADECFDRAYAAAQRDAASKKAVTPTATPMPRPSLRWLAGWLLNRCPASWSRWAPRSVIESAYRQLQHHRLEGF